MSKIEDAVMKKIYERSLVGERKYGVTMERQDLTKIQWLIHGQEEAMDLAVYFEKLIVLQIEEDKKIKAWQKYTRNDLGE